MKLSTTPLALLALTAGTCRGETASNDPAVSCCIQRGGTSGTVVGLTGESGICTYKGRNYEASFFLDTFCGRANFPVVNVQYTQCIQPNQEGFQITCLNCCESNYHNFQARCGSDRSCLSANGSAFNTCEDGCVNQCVGYCFENDTDCVNQCDQTVGQSDLRQNCFQTCTEQAELCYQQCVDQRNNSANSIGA
ncbi:unnamed protein product [Pseudo-nitzschia multistriata]|uniref:Uncharacterized protein n=1 Tax=Pseudo-nitzschia multistriata TaxID=183589 RepID=A0A448YWG3_9STRA|nr:unnamed protein product [Pseudo-nitzschia multistriata]